MAIIKVTQKNFTNLLSEKIDNMGTAGLFASAIMGGKEEIRKAICNMPDEHPLWVNTDHIVAASAPIKIEETGDLVFRIYFKQLDKEEAIWVKGEDYKRFILAWAGEERWVCEGEYKVPEGYRAVSCDDGKHIVVEKI